ncbi:MAG: integrin [Candidatus Rariloculaceae bacterium]
MGFGLKEIQFSWPVVEEADHYRLLASLDGSAVFSAVGGNLSAMTTSTTVPVAVHLYPWETARYVLEACNADGCTRSAEISPIDGILDTIGYVKASNSDVDDQFGGGSVIYGLSAAISRDGNTMAVTSIFEDSAATGIDGDQTDNSALDAGSVYVFQRDDDGWAQQAYVKASNAESSDQFGYSVALSGDGDTLAVGANLEASSATGINGDQSDNSAPGAGAVYVFARASGEWSQQAYVKASNSDGGDVFGYQVALNFDGDTLVVTAQGEDSASPGIDLDQINNDAGGAGAAYVFTRDGGTWSQQSYLKSANPEVNDLFGSSVAMSDDGNTILVGALDEDGGQATINGDESDNSARGSGAAYVFVRNGSRWSQQGYIKGSNTQAADAFGATVAMSADGNTLAVGAPDENNTSTGAHADLGHRVGFDPRTDHSFGSAYIFARQNGNWTEQAYIKPSHLGQFDQFGTRVALSGDGNILAVGVPLEDSPAVGLNGSRENDESGGTEFGAVYLYTRENGRWSDHNYVKAPNAGVYDEFGSVIALNADGSTMIVGARFEDSAATGVDGDQGHEYARDAGAIYVF